MSKQKSQATQTNKEVVVTPTEATSIEEVEAIQTTPATTRRPTFLEKYRGMQPVGMYMSSLPAPVFNEDGILAVTIPKATLEKGKQYCQFTFVGRLDFRKTILYKVRAFARKIWKPSGDWKVVPLGKSYFMLRLADKDEFLIIWSQV